jgi:soluble lytic murein transglycosylase
LISPASPSRISTAGSGVTTPVSTSRALYWQGRAAEASGELELASDRFTAAAGYPTAYYGQLASWLWGRTQPSLICRLTPIPAKRRAPPSTLA